MNYGIAEDRWAGVGPYYAMFPNSFSNEVINEFSEPGDVVLDAFDGRGTSVFSAARNGRCGVGIEINPLGWVYAKTKLGPASRKKVESRLKILSLHAKKYTSLANRMPQFFRICYSNRVLSFLLASRDLLNWKKSKVDRTLMAFLLICLHGKYGSALSNQMRQTKSMAPEYSIRWWRNHGYSPPNLDPEEFMMSRISWRYAKGVPQVEKSFVYHGDCRKVLSELSKSNSKSSIKGKARLLFTSPPYCGVTNYQYDQWLRLWLLGFPLLQDSGFTKNDGRYSNQSRYVSLLRETFEVASKCMTKDARIYIRTDARQFTLHTTIQILQDTFPDKQLAMIRRPVIGNTQTRLFGDFESKAGEVDLVM